MNRAFIVASLVALGDACSCPPVPRTTSDGGGGPGSDGGPVSQDGGGPAGDGGDPCAAPPMSGSGTQIAGALDTPRRIAVGGDQVLIVESGVFMLNNGRVLSVLRAGGVPMPVMTGLNDPDAVAADSAGLYVVDQFGVWTLEADGGRGLVDTTLNNSVFGDTDLAISPSTVVFASGLRWFDAIPRDGGMGTHLFAGDAGTLVRGAAIDGATAYFFVSGQGLYSVPIDGSAPATPVSAGPGDGTSLTVTPAALIWTGDGGVVYAPKDGGSPVLLASGLAGPRTPVQIGAYVYFKNAATAPEFFLRASLCAPGTATPVGPSGSGPGGLATDGTSLFFTSSASGSQGFAARLP